MIKVGIISTAYFRLEDYEQGMKKMKEHGYDCVDFQEFMSMNSLLYAMSDAEFERKLCDIRAAAEKNGLEIYQLHSIWPTAGDSTEEGRQKSLWYYRRSILGAKHLGCKRVIVHPWMKYGWSDGTKEEFFELNVQLMKSLMPTARECDVYVCLENMPFRKGKSFSTVEEWLAVIKATDDKYAKACLDTGHLNVMEADAYSSLVALKGYLEAMHVHDNRGYVDMHLLPYQGNFDWGGWVKGLREIGFDGCVSLETCVERDTPVEVKEGLQRLYAETAKVLAKKI